MEPPTPEYLFPNVVEASLCFTELFTAFNRTQANTKLTDTTLTHEPTGRVIARVAQLGDDEFCVEALIGGHRFRHGNLLGYAYQTLKLSVVAFKTLFEKEMATQLFEALLEVQGRQLKAGYEMVEYSADPWRPNMVVLDCIQRKTHKGNASIYRLATVLHEGKWHCDGRAVELADHLDLIATAQRQFLEVVSPAKLDKCEPV